MKTRPTHTRRVLCLTAAVAVALMSIACGARGTAHLLAEEVGTPTPTAVTSETSDVELENTGTKLDVIGKGTIKFADWQDNAINLENTIAGYLMVWGYGYSVELIEKPFPQYQDALARGELDVVMEIPKDDSPGWYVESTQSGAIEDVGSLFEGKPDVRIGVHSSLVERAPELVELLAKMTPGDELLASLTARITAGRTGIKPSVATLVFLRQHEDVWTKWVPPDVAENVRDAIAAGKTSLRNRMCIPQGVESGDCGN